MSKKENNKKGNIYDKILKENIEAVFLPLIEKYLHFRIVESEIIDAKIQSTIERENDFIRIIRTDKEEQFILHLEFQTQNEAGMIYRIKEYNALIQRKYKLEIRHYVIFLGKGKLTMKTKLGNQMVFTGFNVLNLNNLDYAEMISSQIPEEIIFAVLSNDQIITTTFMADIFTVILR